MRTKSTVQVKNQMYRIDRMMMVDDSYPKNLKRFKKWVGKSEAIEKQILTYFGVRHYWEQPACERMHEPLPYELRIVR